MVCIKELRDTLVNNTTTIKNFKTKINIFVLTFNAVH